MPRMSMKRLLVVTAVLEAGAGVALLCCPSATVVLLLGQALETADAATLGRVAGTALLALGVASWLAQDDAQGRATRGLVSAMTLYNLGTVVILAVAGIRSAPVGVAERHSSRRDGDRVRGEPPETTDSLRVL